MGYLNFVFVHQRQIGSSVAILKASRRHTRRWAISTLVYNHLLAVAELSLDEYLLPDRAAATCIIELSLHPESRYFDGLRISMTSVDSGV